VLVTISPLRFGALCVLGCAGSVLYLFLAAVFWTDAIFLQSRLLTVSIYAAVALLSLFYFAGIPLVRRTSVRVIVVFAAIFGFVGFIAGPFDSTDVFYYMAQGWEQHHYRGNPYSQVLRDIPEGLNDPMIASRWMELNRNPWLDEPLPYGFAFAIVARTIAWLGGGNWLFTLGLFSLLNLAIHGLMAYLLWKIAPLIPGTDPRLVLYLYTWSPLIVLQFLVNSHNDLIMASLILLAFYMIVAKRDVWALPALVAAGFVKYLAFALVPFVLAYLVRKRAWKQIVVTVTLSLILTAVVSAPYVGAISTFKFAQIYEQFAESSGSLHAFLTFSARAVSRLAAVEEFEIAAFSRMSKILLWSIVGLFTLYQLRRAWAGRRYTPKEIATRWTSVLFAIVFIGSSQFYSWYIGILFPLSLLGAGRSVLTDIVVMLSGTHLLFAFLRGKAIGYFLISTAIPITVILWWRERASSTGMRRLAWGLPVVKRVEGSVTPGNLDRNDQ
jgi:hypothetical protein